MATLDFTKTPTNERVAIFMGPTASGALGVTDVNEPLAAELNNTGSTSGVLNISKAVSWNDFDFGIQASDTNSDPSIADASSYEEFTQYNYGGGMSYYRPKSYDDASNLLSLVYDMTEAPETGLDVAMRIDGDLDYTTAAVDGDLVSVFRVETDSETNVFGQGDAKRRTVGFMPKGVFSHLVPVGLQTVVAIGPATYNVGSKGRIRASVQGRDVTNMMEFSTSDPAVIEVYPGGVFVVTGAALNTATVTITHPGTGGTTPVAISVAA
jgi:hypothetical protein